MKKLKSAITLIIVLTLCLSFLVVVFTMLDVEMSKTIVATFLTIATSVIGFFVGYQTNKLQETKTESEKKK